jgi:ribosomal-protein-alanine N-acetyltransferase
MKKIIIEIMTNDDIEDVAEVEKRSFNVPWSKESFRREIENNKVALYLVAKVDNKAVGYIGVWRIINEGHITNLAVHPEYRKMGVANALVETMISLCSKEGIAAFTLEVRESNLIAQHLYRKFGFEDKGKRRGYYQDNNEDAIIMWKFC